jgi:2-succinyl-5-enolpyruvyl-6-hydroxy-3-cyclohexene-1-carboxylate synthase
MAQRTQSPVVICCTSGTALLNYAPAVAEAFYQKIPLIVLSADRPPEWIDQWDGQTIRQQGALEPHVKKSFQLPVNTQHPDETWEYLRKLSEGVLISNHTPKGPVHLNVPFREPFYPEESDALSYSQNLSLPQLVPNLTEQREQPDLPKEWERFQRKMLVVGQMEPNPAMVAAVIQWAKHQKIPVVADVTANLFDHTFIDQHDLFLGTKPSLPTPDLVIYAGKSLLSKSLKKYLRKVQPEVWHFQPDMEFSFPLQKAEKLFSTDLSQLFDWQLDPFTQEKSFCSEWQDINLKTREKLQETKDFPFSETSAAWWLSRQIPPGYNIHLANSMPVRWFNLFRFLNSPKAVYANRGTSGIDGSNGTAVGHALASDDQVLLISGDLSFLYDRNAFFHPYELSNFRIIVFNNFGGGIFNLIPGPLQLPEHERGTHFITPHQKNLKLIAEDLNLTYHLAKDHPSLVNCTKSFFEPSMQGQLLEIQTNPKINQETYFRLKNIL